MSYKCKILLDSISPTGKRLTTFEVTFPRIVLAEFNTHRMFSRNSASSRAIPLKKQIERIDKDPFVPEQFPLNCSGMQPQEYITQDHVDYKNHKHRWLHIKDLLIEEAFYASQIDFNWHKQIVSRLLEPFMWHTVIVTATEFDNFFKLRTNENAQFEIKRIADLMYDAYHAFDNLGLNSKYDSAGSFTENWTAINKQKLEVGEWHTPLIFEEDAVLIDDYLRHSKDYTLDNGNDFRFAFIDVKKKVSVARCARVSYLTHDGKRDIGKDLELFEKLRTSGHWSPFEHVATPNCETISDIISTAYYIPPKDHWSGNFLGWNQYRKEFKDENCVNFRKE